jgi:integration host factor subunit beta
MESKNTFVKSDLVKELHGHFKEIPYNRVEQVVDSLFRYLSNQLAEGKNIELRYFGRFKVKQMQSRKGRNPATGQTLEISPKKKISWKSSKYLNSLINLPDGESLEKTEE